MHGLGTIANCAAIALGAVLGLLFRRGLPKKWQQTIMGSMALCVVVIGIQMALKTGNIVVVVAALAIGAVIGELLDIEAAMQRFGDWLGSKVAGGDASAAAAIAKGFVSASVLFCSGAMSIVGSLQDGLAGDHTTLFAKATIDGIIAMILTANMGLGVIFSAVSVGVFQGTITLLAGAIAPLITDAVLNEVTAAGGVMIMGIGTNMLHLTEIRIANLLPGVLAVAVLAEYFM